VGDRAFETKLTSRVLAVVAPALVAVGAASVALTWWALDSADAGVARARAESALAAIHSELLEPDPFPQAAREVLGAVDEIGGSLVVIDLQSGRVYESRRPVPRELAATPPGACAKHADSGGERWRACAVRDERVAIVAAVDVTPHAKVVRTVAEGVALEILLALLAAALIAYRGLVDAIARARATSENIAHELRTPLTAMRAELEALALVPPADAPRALARLGSDVDRLSRVVDAILVLASPPGRSRAAGLVVNLADVARELAPAGARVEAPDEALVMAEPRLVELAIANLLENARKHAGREAHTIRVERVGAAAARVAVIDDGPGLADEARARMFDRYWRARGPGDSTDAGGTGLGLAFVRAVAQRFGGEARAHAVPGGPGLEVEITFGSVVGWHDGAAIPAVTDADSPRPAR
jgi:signal transduction histidine kinase